MMGANAASNRIREYPSNYDLPNTNFRLANTMRESSGNVAGFTAR
jgi:hypothetical protein